MHWTRFVLMGALTLSPACTESTQSTGPDVQGRSYALVDVDRVSPPVLVAGETWLADTIRFDAQNTWQRVQVLILHGEGSSPDPVRRETQGWVTRLGGRIVLDFSCPDLALCLAPDTLRAVGDGLVRQAIVYGDPAAPRPEFTYQRIP